MKKSKESPKSQNVNRSLYARYKNMADDEAALKIFDVIEKQLQISERKITSQTGLAAGLVNSFMRRVISKGWVRAKRVNAKRWLYFLTPEGLMEKSRLTMKYLSITLKTYRITQKQIQTQIATCRKNRWYKVTIVGVNELAEIAVINILAARRFVLVGVVNPDGVDYPEKEFLGVKMLSLNTLKTTAYDKMLLCDTSFLEWNKKNGRFYDESKMLNIVPSSIHFE